MSEAAAGSGQESRGRFCADCGGPLTFDPERAHPSCDRCGSIRYRNPVAGVAVVVRDAEGRVLLGRRARGAYAGLWCIPCGYVEWDEHVREAAEREFREETGLETRTGAVVAVHSNFHNSRQHTVGIWFRGEVVGGELAPDADELDAVTFAHPGEPPPLAFPTDALVLAQLAAEDASRRA